MRRPWRIFYLFSEIMFAVALLFLADALGVPIDRKLGRAWAWVNCALFGGLGMMALYFGYVAERISQMENALGRVERMLEQMARPSRSEEKTDRV